DIASPPSPHGVSSPTTAARPSPTTGSTPSPVSNPTPTPTPTQGTYQVTVVTGDVPGAGTDANVYISLFGYVASSSDNRLNSTIARFEQVQTEVFSLPFTHL